MCGGYCLKMSNMILKVVKFGFSTDNSVSVSNWNVFLKGSLLQLWLSFNAGIESLIKDW